MKTKNCHKHLSLSLTHAVKVCVVFCRTSCRWALIFFLCIFVKFQAPGWWFYGNLVCRVLQGISRNVLPGMSQQVWAVCFTNMQKWRVFEHLVKGWSSFANRDVSISQMPNEMKFLSELHPRTSLSCCWSSLINRHVTVIRLNTNSVFMQLFLPVITSQKSILEQCWTEYQ